MSDEQILEVLKKFDDFLQIGNIVNYCIRWIGWMLIQGLAWLVDGLENITDSILGLKTFFAGEDVQGFITKVQPFLYVILAFSILYIGYQILMNRKTNREQIVMNIFISIAVLLLLNTGMIKADKFTDEAILAVNLGENGSTSEKIIKDGLTDIALFDLNGWTSAELEESNLVPQERIKKIDITEKIDGDFLLSEDRKVSEDGDDILDNKLALTGDGQDGLSELQNGWFDFFPEQYYRWQWDFWTIAISLFVTGMTLLFITIKLAKLCYELAFNYILANLIAPADINSGQMLKQVLKSIVNTFLIIIMIFISMKVYLMGTVFISENLDGMAYLIALIAISIAVVDGPMLCERLFGIDAGLKSGWGVVAGGYAAGKAMAGAATTVGTGIATLATGGAAGGLLAASTAAGAVSGLMGEGKDDKGDNKEKKGDKEGKSEKGGNDFKNQLMGGGANSEKGDEGKETEQERRGMESETESRMEGNALQNEMMREGLDDDSGSSGTGNRAVTLEDEMNASVYNGSQNYDTPSSYEAAATSDNIGSRPSLHDEMNDSGFIDNSSQMGGAYSPSSNNGVSLSSEMDYDSPGGLYGSPGAGIGSDSLNSEKEYDSYSSGSSNSGSSNEGFNSERDYGLSPTGSPYRPYNRTDNDRNEGSGNQSSPVIPNTTSRNQNRTENRTIRQYANDRVREKLITSPMVQRSRRAYQIGRNTTQSWRNNNNE